MRTIDDLEYDQETGVMRWTDTGEEAGHSDKSLGGRVTIRMGGRKGKKLYRYRLAWFIMTGAWPEGEIDHIDGDPTNDRWDNLRDVSHRDNLQNRRRAARNNKVGVLGVCPNGSGFSAQINVGGVKHHLGTFRTPELAHAAHVEAKRRLHSGCTI